VQVGGREMTLGPLKCVDRLLKYNTGKTLSLSPYLPPALAASLPFSLLPFLSPSRSPSLSYTHTHLDGWMDDGMIERLRDN